jgi:hypothetical protein
MSAPFAALAFLLQGSGNVIREPAPPPFSAAMRSVYATCLHDKSKLEPITKRRSLRQASRVVRNAAAACVQQRDAARDAMLAEHFTDRDMERELQVIEFNVAYHLDPAKAPNAPH